MTHQNTRRGFTLIELLIVVLIIAILAAVALPQYRTAVDKTRFAAFIPLLKAVADAKSVYYLGNGKWPEKFEDLAIDLPKGFTSEDSASYKQIASNTSKKQYIRLEASDHRVIGQMLLSDGSDILYYMPTSQYRSIRRCAARLNTHAARFCDSIPGTQHKGTDSQGLDWWNIP